eukprot:scaffold84794_cov22-Tisochrysis_lutea.AAC.2
MSLTSPCSKASLLPTHGPCPSFILPILPASGMEAKLIKGKGIMQTFYLYPPEETPRANEASHAPCSIFSWKCH